MRGRKCARLFPLTASLSSATFPGVVADPTTLTDASAQGQGARGDDGRKAAPARGHERGAREGRVCGAADHSGGGCPRGPLHRMGDARERIRGALLALMWNEMRYVLCCRMDELYLTMLLSFTSFDYDRQD